jgi:hypothetical protein
MEKLNEKICINRRSPLSPDSRYRRLNIKLFSENLENNKEVKIYQVIQFKLKHKLFIY